MGIRHLQYLSYESYIIFTDSTHPDAQLITEEDWPRYATLGERQLKRYMLDYDVFPLPDESIEDGMTCAICAMAEVYAIHDQDRITSASIGSVHVNYGGVGDAVKDLQKELYRAAKKHLDIRRGVS